MVSIFNWLDRLRSMYFVWLDGPLPSLVAAVQSAIYTSALRIEVPQIVVKISYPNGLARTSIEQNVLEVQIVRAWITLNGLDMKMDSKQVPPEVRLRYIRLTFDTATQMEGWPTLMCQMSEISIELTIPLPEDLWEDSGRWITNHHTSEYSLSRSRVQSRAKE